MTTLPPVDIERVVNEVQKIVDRAMEVDGGLGGVPVSVSYLRAMLYHLHERLRVVDVAEFEKLLKDYNDAVFYHGANRDHTDAAIEWDLKTINAVRSKLLSSFKALKLQLAGADVITTVLRKRIEELEKFQPRSAEEIKSNLEDEERETGT